MRISGDYRQRLAERLRSLLDSRGTSVRWVETKLDHGRGYVADALRGNKRLSVETILEVLAVLGVSPEEFFERPKAERLSRVDSPPTPTVHAEALPPSLRKSSPVLQAVVLLLANQGLLSLRDLQDVHRELAHAGDDATPAPKRESGRAPK